MVAGRPGARYAVRLVNNSGERVLAVVAIDGVNVVSGETAGVGQRGYVLEPWQRTEITGWRKSDDEVAAFEFTSLADSYAARTGRPLRRRRDRRGGVPRGAGARGVDDAPRRAPVAASPRPVSWRPAKAAPRRRRRDRVAPPRRPPRCRAAWSAAAPIAAARPTPPAALQPRPADRLGTGHGARETSVARVTPFERASAQPDQRVEIRYDSLDNLVAAGIVPPPRLASTAPHAFPADPPRDFVPDPPRR